MNTKFFSKVVAGALAVAIAAVGIFAMPSATYAQGTNPPSTPSTPIKPGDKEKYGEKLLERVKKNLAEMKANLAKANDVVTKAQETIADAKSKGKDTTKVEAALATYKAEIAKAQTSYDAAQKLFDTHPGFDGSGSVTDRDLAKQTMLDLTKNLKDAQQTLAKATREFQKAAKEIRSENKDKVKPTATPKP
jgi:peptidoglycan hydrolase CwlO-like protein